MQDVVIYGWHLARIINVDQVKIIYLMYQGIEE